MEKTLKRFNPVGENMLLQPKKAAEVSDGGIYIPESARGGLTQGTVVKKGALVTEYEIGDEILFAQHTETRLEMDGEPYILLNQANVLMFAKGN
jgi:co-chaperonin GroES (HSP10)